MTFAASAAAYDLLKAACLEREPACLGDLRFVADENDRATQNELRAICEVCTVFAECRNWLRATVSEQRTGFIAGWQTLIRPAKKNQPRKNPTPKGTP